MDFADCAFNPVPSVLQKESITGVVPVSFTGQETTDPLLKMNLVELLNHLQTTGQNVREFFGMRAYRWTSPFYSRLLEIQLAIAVLTNDTAFLEKHAGNTAPTFSDVEKIGKTQLEEKLAIFTKLASSCFTLKYIDGVNRQFVAPWHIQSRSAVCVLIDGMWHVISAMPRGPEVAGDSQHGVTELQDATIGGDLKHFATHYQTIMNAMNGVTSGDEFQKVIASSKRDGMCFRAIFLKTGTPLYKWWMDALHMVDDRFINIFMEKSHSILGGLLIPASNGTAFLTEYNIQGWMACALALTEGVHYDTLKYIIKRGATPADILVHDNCVDKFISKLVPLVVSTNVCQMHTWEAVCPHRMCPYDEQPHAELASEYDEDASGMSYLGYSYTSDAGELVWIPHNEISNDFKEPVYWCFDNATILRHALADLSNVFKGDISYDEYFHRYPVANKTKNYFLPDPEGFIAYVLMHVGGESKWIYTKAKTWLYYVLHKIKVEHVLDILKMPPHLGKPFPGYKLVQTFFGNTDQMVTMFTDLRKLIVSPSEEFISAIPEKARKALGKKVELDFKIVLNNVSDDLWNKTSVSVASNHFPYLSCFTSDEQVGLLGHALKSSLMVVRAFEIDWEKRLADEFDVTKISTLTKLPPVSAKLWEFFGG